ncbi:cytochrome P450 86B1-like [Magnolia sinica]|uniref:cytochrome P450 86B1-like n=1 Tax=Magnolia sinica TaxID=86752 RepID=UPI002657DA13|nr:cytochrome P450 86B1-like [Magnolia sinica]
MVSWFMCLYKMLSSYPEIFLAFACFFFIKMLRIKGNVLVSWPIFGMLPSLLLNSHRLHDWLNEVMTRNGLTFVFCGPWFTHMDAVITCDPANVNHVMHTNFSNFPKGSDYIKMFDILGDGIFNSESESWRFQRRKAQAHLKCTRFRRFTAKTTKERVEKALFPVLNHIMQKGKYVDLQDVLHRFMLDNTFILIFGADPNCLSIDFPALPPIVKAMDDASEAVLFRHLVPQSWWRLLWLLKIGKEKKLYEAWKTIDNFIYQRISMRRKEIKETNGLEESGDLLTSYMDEMEGGAESDSFLRDTVLNFLFAGKDTTSAGITWFFWLISKNPSAKTKILEELKAIAAKKEQVSRTQLTVFDTEEVSKLVYLQAALCESLRLFPPIPFEHKGVLQTDILPSGETVQANTKIIFSLFSMGRMEAIWGKDCLEFKPERWITEQGSLKFEPSYKFTAFITGPRSCLGREFAFTQMKAVAAAVLYNFQVHVMDGHPVSPRFSVVLHMKDGLMVRISEGRCS